MNDTALKDPEERGDLSVSSLNFPIVGIGASAGGMNALLRFFENMPAGHGMAFVVILHLSPKHDSNAALILQRATTMRVSQVTQTVPIEPDHVYVIPPTSDLSMSDGYLHLSKPDRVKGRPVAIDLFFRTLAHVHKERAVCVVLSGTGADGAVGLTRIKEQGGITFAQSPEDAEHDGMPRAAIATGSVDIVLPVVEMPQRLIDLWANARQIRMPADAAQAHAIKTVEGMEERPAEDALRDIMSLLRHRTRHDFGHYKRATVLRRIERRLQVSGVPDMPAYRDYLQNHPEETEPLLQDMLISVTNFFRDREAFEALERDVMPALFKNRSPNDTIRVWVAGCATGEEAYSVAMLLREQSDLQPTAIDFQVFATDIDERAITTARLGLYPASIVTDVSPGRLRQFFTPDQNQYQIAKSLREKMLFAVHNVLRDPPFSKVDLICCRNLLIYLDRTAQSKILEMFHFALRPEGYLFLGTSEAPDSQASLFVSVDKKNRIYRMNPATHGPRYLATLPETQFERRTKTPNDSVRERAQPTFAELHQRALEPFAPPSVLIDSENKILHLSDGAGRYLELGGGTPSHNLLSTVHPALRLELRTTLFTASRSGNITRAPGVIWQHGPTPSMVNMSVRPFREPGNEKDFALVVFDEVSQPERGVAKTQPVLTDQGLITELHSEIKKLKEQLQDTIEQAESSTEELKASNEELQAINEELRSATEELETSKEELQSMNEELMTVNYELKSKVEETAKINDDLQNLISSSDIATIFIDSGLRIKRYTPRALDIFNLIASDVGRSLLDITHRLDYDALSEDAGETFTTLRVIERQVQSIDGKHYLARVLPYRTTEHKIDGAVLTFVDVTALRETEERLRVGEESLRLAAETTKDYAIFTLDKSGLITTWNAGAARIFGYSAEEIVGKPGALVFTAEDREKRIPEDEMRRARENGRAEEERWHLRKDGSTFYCSGVLTPLQTETLKGYARIARDMTGHKRQESARDELLTSETAERLEAQASNELKDEFLAVMSHELKLPLNLIHVNAELLTRLPEVRNVPTVTRAVETIRRTVVSQAKIIDDLLDLSRVRTGKLTLNLSPEPLKKIVDLIVDAMKGDAAKNNIQLEFTCEEPAPVAICDPVRTEQIVWNLMSNAIKFTPGGGKITVRLTREDKYAKLTVADTGRGIAPQFLTHVFGMFNQDSGHRVRPSGGLGIGLALVQELSTAQGGRVLAASPGLGHGATFTVWLPLEDKPKQEPATEIDATAQGLAGMRILMVDDSIDSLEVFAELLRLEGAEVETALSGRPALELLERSDFDLLISDVGMAGMDGYQLIAEVRKRPLLVQLPAIAITGYGRARDAQSAIQAGFDAHLSKPTSIDDLKRVVARLGAERAS